MGQNISPELEQSMSNKLLEATKAAGLNFYLNFWKSKFTFVFFSFKIWTLGVVFNKVLNLILSFPQTISEASVWSVKHETSQS